MLSLLLVACGADRRPAPAPPERVRTIVQDDAELLHRSPERIGATLDLLAGLGVDMVRITAGWDVTEREGFARIDRAVDAARERGLEVLIDIAFWAPPDAVSRRVAEGRERWEPDPGRYADFAEVVAQRYRGRAQAFALWNEPNHDVFLLPQWTERDGELVPASPHVYRAMVAAAHPRVKAAAPDASVLIGNLSSTGAQRPRSRASRMPPLRFLRAMACVDEALEPLDAPECAGFAPIPGDGFAHHPYDQDSPPEASAGDARPDDAGLGDLGRLTALLRELHARGRLAGPLPVWLTEYGYQTDPPDPTRSISPQRQAEYLARAERLARSHSEVRATAQFLVRDLPERPGADLRTRWRDYQSGLLFENGRPKPALAAFARPVVAEGDRVWSLVRPGRGPRPVRIEADGRVIARGTTDADGVFEATGIAVAPGARLAVREG